MFLTKVCRGPLGPGAAHSLVGLQRINQPLRKMRVRNFLASACGTIETLHLIFSSLYLLTMVFSDY